MIKSLLPVFFTVFLAELGDKTQLATVLFSAEGTRSAWLVFAASATALVLACAIGVLAGTFAQKYLAMIPLKLIAGIGFMAIGAWVVLEYFKDGRTA